MNLESKQRLASVVKQLRGHQTLESFGAKFGVSHATVSNWESGNSEPNRERLEKIAHYAGYSLEDFICVIEGKKPNTPNSVSRIKTEVRGMGLSDLIAVQSAVTDRLKELASL
jgi:transcriptional regulator with XRE-family HTH domain